jgi:hypothetical protein
MWRLSRKAAELGDFPKLAHPMHKTWHWRNRHRLTTQAKGKTMQYLENFSGKVVAAVSSVAFSAILLATAIIPAQPSVFAAGGLA